MSGPENSSNEPRRDFKFYHRDAITFFLVQNTEFRFQASLLDADTDDYEFKQIMQNTSSDSENDVGQMGTVNVRSIVLPDDVTPDEFRDLLMVQCGGVTNYAFLDFFETLQTPSSCGPSIVTRLISIGYLACRFGMERLDIWSQDHICTILEKGLLLAPQRNDDWNAHSILRIVEYMQRTTITHHRHKILDLMRDIISDQVQDSYELNEEVPKGNIIDICAALYKEKDLLINSPGFFGLIFAVIISLGHQSDVWANRLTRDDRRVLYVAHATFTCLSDHADLALGWLKDPTAIKGVCSLCSHRFRISWWPAFSRCQGLKSRAPLEDIRHVVALANYRTHFLRFGSASHIADETCWCEAEVLGDIERRIESLYCGLTEKYKSLAETV